MRIFFTLILLTFINKAFTQSANAGFNQIFCWDSTRLEGNVPDEPNEGIWKVIEGKAIFEDPKDPFTKVIEVGLGENVLSWSIIDTLGFVLDSDSVIIINISAYPDSKVTLDSDTVFLGDSLKIIGVQPIQGTGEWSITNGSGDISDYKDYNTFISNLSLGITTVRWTITNSMCYVYDEASFFVTDGNVNLLTQMYSNKKINVFPNPFRNNLHISTIDNIEEIKIVNMKGQICKIVKCSEDQQSFVFDLGILEKGSYLVTVKTSKIEYVQTIIKE